MCLTDAADTYSGKYPDVVREGYAHYALLGSDWIDKKAWTRSKRVPEGVDSVCLPLRPWCEAPPSWQDFTAVPKEVRAACECLEGLLMSGVSFGICPVIAGCSDWPRSDPEFVERIRTSPNLPVRVEPGEARVWTLQHNYYDVETHVVAPGHIVLTDGRGGLQVLTDMTARDWLA
ncbi:MAG TPA: hypothetical protein EYQ27_11060 [Gemmatimonadetes bacterium]|nr:hypothetical protein [Gemmatimonadota bacterium]